MNPEQQTFLEDEFFSMTLMATVQRGKLYRVGSGEAEKDAFRRALRSELERLTEQYSVGVSEAQHLANIESLANSLSGSHPNALNAGRFRIGSAQKALNLHLKYMWCLGLIPAPPHCPFDFMVLSRIPTCRNVKWTQHDSLPEYERIVCLAKTAAGNSPLAEWELRLYNAAQPVAPAGCAASGAPLS
ncbi:MAG: hypothetical protein IT471_07265 [Pseudomonadales bacterium]|mgnify:CR=1 FL=1|nr:hypothetical protein [Pseudomonadales bacterium]MCP5332140.1 hypothetical protein [Pseudomonadales bacterium]